MRVESSLAERMQGEKVGMKMRVDETLSLFTDKTGKEGSKKFVP